MFFEKDDEGIDAIDEIEILLISVSMLTCFLVGSVRCQDLMFDLGMSVFFFGVTK